MKIVQVFFIIMIMAPSVTQAALPQDKREIVIAHGQQWVVIEKMADGMIIALSVKDRQLKGFFTPEFLESEKNKYKKGDKTEWAEYFVKLEKGEIS